MKYDAQTQEIIDAWVWANEELEMRGPLMCITDGKTYRAISTYEKIPEGWRINF